MSKHVTATMQYENADPATVYAMFIDPEYVRTKSEGTGGSNVEVDVAEEGGGHKITTARELPADVPSFAKKFTGDSIQAKETDVWAPAAADGVRTGTVDIEFVGLPIQLKGEMKMESKDGGTLVTVEMNVKASVPFVGGKLEGIGADQFTRAVNAEGRIGKDWLAKS